MEFDSPERRSPTTASRVAAGLPGEGRIRPAAAAGEPAASDRARPKRFWQVEIAGEDEEESLVAGLKNRLLQLLARIAPGATTLRVWLNRWRGVEIGQGSWIGYDAVIETGFPRLVRIGERVSLGMRATIIAHFHETRGVLIEDEAFIGPGVIILPNVTIGRGAVVAAGSVVSASVPPMTMVQGNPARPVARCGVPLGFGTLTGEFFDKLKPL